MLFTDIKEKLSVNSTVCNSPVSFKTIPVIPAILWKESFKEFFSIDESSFVFCGMWGHTIF